MIVAHRITFIGRTEAVQLFTTTVLARNFHEAMNEALAQVIEHRADISTLGALRFEVTLEISDTQRRDIMAAQDAYLLHMAGVAPTDVTH